MANRFSEEYKIDIWGDPFGSTEEQFMPYLDMLGYDSVDFIVNGSIKGATAAAGSTDVQVITCRLLQASGATGAGVTAISSATCSMTKGGSAITTASHGKSLVLYFSTMKSSAAGAATFTIIGEGFTMATAGGAATVVQVAEDSDATTISEAFKTAFDLSTLSSSWKATTQAGSPRIYIRPKTATSVGSTVYVSVTGAATNINAGIPELGGHIGLRSEHMKDGCRYITIGVKTTNIGTPFQVTCIRKKIDLPITQTNEQFAVSKVLGSTSV
jgi:hypothetical protein